MVEEYGGVVQVRPPDLLCSRRSWGVSGKPNHALSGMPFTRNWGKKLRWTLEPVGVARVD